MTELQRYISSYFGMDVFEVQKIQEFFYPTAMVKDAFYTQEGKGCDSLSFIRSGHFRVFTYGKDREVTQWLSSPGEFITDLSSMVFNSPSRWNIQALTDCELYTIAKSDYQKINQFVPNWDQLEKLFIAKCFLMLEDRVHSFIALSAEERFQMLFGRNKELFNQVPLQYIASMLGMTPETLSRIRKKTLS